MSHRIPVRFFEQYWADSILPTFQEFIRIPNVSPAFAADWAETGHMDRAVRLITEWFQQQLPEGRVHVGRLPGHTPAVILEVPGTTPNTFLMYGHLDKQPGVSGWDAGLGPWTPVIRNGRLYGRGAVDDGYAPFTAVAIAKALRQHNLPAPRILVLLECAEESGSPGLLPYCEHFAELIGTPFFILCLDAGGANFDQPWISTSARGLVQLLLQVEVLTGGVHSGGASGVVPSSFRILRQLLSRVEDESTGAMLPPWLQVQIPAARVAQAEELVAALGPAAVGQYPLVPGMQLAHSDPVELVLARTWCTTLSYIGVDGIPNCQASGNVLRPATAMKLSFRLPPTLKSAPVAQQLQALLTRDPPYGARVTGTIEEAADGWEARPFPPQLNQRLNTAAVDIFGRPPLSMGLGGSIPLLALFGERFPQAQILTTGALGPNSNAHGPNECLEIAFAQKLAAWLAAVIAER